MCLSASDLVDEHRQLGDRRCRNCPHVYRERWDGNVAKIVGWTCILRNDLVMTKTDGEEEWHFEAMAPDNCPLTERCPACWGNAIHRPDGKTTVGGLICEVCGGVGSVTPEQFFIWAGEQSKRLMLKATMIPASAFNEEDKADASGT